MATRMKEKAALRKANADKRYSRLTNTFKFLLFHVEKAG